MKIKLTIFIHNDRFLYNRYMLFLADILTLNELYLEPDDVKQNAYEIFNRNGDLLNPIILKKSK